MNFDRRLLELLRRYPLPFALCVAFGTIGGGFLIAQAYLLSRIVDTLFLNRSDMDGLIRLLVIYATASLLRALFNWACQAQAHKGTLKIKQFLHHQLFDKISALGPIYSLSTQSGTLNAKIIRGVEALDPYFSQFIPQVFLSVLLPVTILAVVFPTDMITGFILLATAPLIPLFMIIIGKTAQKATQKQWQTLSRMSGYFLDVLQGLFTLKLFGRSRDRVQKISEISEAFRHATMKVLKVAFLSSLTLELVAAIGTAIIAIEIGLRLLDGSLAFATALFLLLLTPDFYLALRQLGTKFHAGMEGVSAASDIFSLIERKSPPETAASLAKTIPAAPLQPIRFENVGFSYSEDRAYALDSVSCDLEPGTFNAVTGSSGSGKTTFINLILRFIEPQKGTIMYGTTELSMLNPGEWRKLISWIPQHPYIFNTTLRENLLLANPAASEQTLVEAVEISRLSPLVSSLPRGLDTPVGEHGSMISGGEAQRLSFARAFIRNAPILILDEPTSHTDPVLEKELVETMETLARGKTTILIAHRLSTIENADRILVFDKGRITQSGTHETLLQSEGYYRNTLGSFREGSPV